MIQTVVVWQLLHPVGHNGHYLFTATVPDGQEVWQEPEYKKYEVPHLKHVVSLQSIQLASEHARQFDPPTSW